MTNAIDDHDSDDSARRAEEARRERERAEQERKAREAARELAKKILGPQAAPKAVEKLAEFLREQRLDAKALQTDWGKTAVEVYKLTVDMPASIRRDALALYSREVFAPSGLLRPGMSVDEVARRLVRAVGGEINPAAAQDGWDGTSTPQGAGFPAVDESSLYCPTTPDYLQEMPQAFKEVYGQVVQPMFDPTSDMALVSMMTSTIELDGHTYDLATLQTKIESGELSVAELKAEIDRLIEHWENIAEKDVFDYADGPLEDFVMGVAVGLNGFTNPLEPLQGFAKELVATLEKTSAALSRASGIEAAQLFFHGSQVNTLGTAYSRSMVEVIGGHVQANYFDRLRLAGDVAVTIGAFAVVVATGGGALGVFAAAGFGFGTGGFLSATYQQGRYGELDPKTLARDLAAYTLSSGSVGLAGLAGPAATAFAARVLAANLKNPAVATFLARRIAGPTAASFFMSAGNEAKNILQGGLPSTPEAMIEMLARLGTGTITGAIPGPSGLFPAALAKHPLLTHMLGEGFQELTQDLAQQLMLGKNPLESITASEAGVTFLTAMAIASFSPTGDFDQIRDQLATQREDFVLELQNSGIDPEVIASFEQQHALISAMLAANPKLKLDPQQIAAIQEAATLFADSSIDPEILANAMVMFGLPGSSAGKANIEHLAQVLDAVRASPLAGQNYDFVTSMSPQEFELLATLFTDATFKGVMPDGAAGGPIAPLMIGDPPRPLAAKTADELWAVLQAQGSKMPPYLLGVMTHGLTGYARAEQLGLAVGMTKAEIQKLFAIQLAHHASHFPIGMMGDAGVRPNFEAMVRAGQLTAADGAALTELYDSMLALVGEQNITPPSMSAEAYAEFSAAAVEVQAAVRALPPELRAQLLSDDLAQFADPRGIGKWVGIGWGTLKAQGVDPINFGEVIRASFADPAFAYAAYNLARDPETPFLELSRPMLSKLGITLSASEAEGLTVGLAGEYTALAGALRDHPRVLAQLGLDVTLDDRALAEAFFAVVPADKDTAARILSELLTPVRPATLKPSTLPAEGIPFDAIPPRHFSATLADGSVVNVTMAVEQLIDRSGNTAYRVNLTDDATGKLVGYYEIYQSPGRKAPIDQMILDQTGVAPGEGPMWFGRVEVATEYRGAKLGSALFEAMSPTMQAIGGRQVTMFSSDNSTENGQTRLMPKYEELGFRPFDLFGDYAMFMDW